MTTVTTVNSEIKKGMNSPLTIEEQLLERVEHPEQWDQVSDIVVVKAAVCRWMVSFGYRCIALDYDNHSMVKRADCHCCVCS